MLCSKLCGLQTTTILESETELLAPCSPCGECLDLRHKAREMLGGGMLFKRCLVVPCLANHAFERIDAAEKHIVARVSLLLARLFHQLLGQSQKRFLF